MFLEMVWEENVVLNETPFNKQRGGEQSPDLSNTDWSMTLS